MNIIFDLDNTLIDAQYELGAKAAFVLGRQGPSHVCGEDLGYVYVYKRPGVEALLEWCFQNFKNVGMWTLAEQKWVDEILENVLKRFPKERWSFIWTGERATKVRSTKENEGHLHGVKHNQQVVLKDLKKVFRPKGFKEKGISRHNTIIVDDTPGNCVRNYGNGIVVSGFDVVKVSSVDTELPRLQLYLQHFILHHKDVRTIDKRDWRSLAIEIEEKEKSQSRSRFAPKKKCFWMHENCFEKSAASSNQKMLGNTQIINNREKHVHANYVCMKGMYTRAK